MYPRIFSFCIWRPFTLSLFLFLSLSLSQIYICHKPRVTCTFKDAPAPGLFFFFFFSRYFRYSKRKIQSRTFLTLRSAISLVTSCFFFFLLVLLSKELDSHSFRGHISFFSFIRLTTCFVFFISRRGRLLDSRKHRLSRLHRQHVTRCLFERRNLVGSLDATVCTFCHWISLQRRQAMFVFQTYEFSWRL